MRHKNKNVSRSRLHQIPKNGVIGSDAMTGDVHEPKMGPEQTSKKRTNHHGQLGYNMQPTPRGETSPLELDVFLFS
jgi:hypothetical protein